MESIPSPFFVPLPVDNCLTEQNLAHHFHVGYNTDILKACTGTGAEQSYKNIYFSFSFPKAFWFILSFSPPSLMHQTFLQENIIVEVVIKWRANQGANQLSCLTRWDMTGCQHPHLLFTVLCYCVELQFSNWDSASKEINDEGTAEGMRKTAWQSAWTNFLVHLGDPKYLEGKG